MTSNILEVDSLTTAYSTKAGELIAVDNVSLAIRKGEAVAVVGESGCGKSALAKSIMGILPAGFGKVKSGNINLDGIRLNSRSDREMEDIRGSRIGMIFQEPMTSLNPMISIGDQIAEPLIRHRGATRSEARRKVVEWLDIVGISNPIASFGEYPHRFSGGMRQRVMIAMALICEPELLIADEPTTALDVTVQAQIMQLIMKLRKQLNMALLLITHDLGIVSENADRVAVMYTGRIIEKGSAQDIFLRPAHPYTKGLLNSVYRWGDVKAVSAKAGGRLAEIKGIVPSMVNLPVGCSFADRCPLVESACREKIPAFVQLSSAHEAACIHARGGESVV